MTILSLLLILGVAPALSQTPATGESLISIDDFSQCGLVTKLQPNKLALSCFQFLENATLDSDGSILRRNGLSAYNSTASTGTQSHRGLWAFTDSNNSQYLIAQTSASMVSSLGNGVWTAINGLNGGLSTTAQMSCTECLGFLWCSNGTNAVFNIGVSLATSTVSQAPLGKYMGCFRNRVVISGVSGFLTNVYLSGQVNGTDWTVPATQLSTSPAIINVSGANDGFPVSCLMGDYQNSFQIGRPYDLYGLAGYDLRDFTLRKIDGQIGCMDNNSSQIVNNTQMWLSHRGVEQLSGPQITWASQPIDPTLKTIITAAGNSQAFAINGNNFNTGNLTASGAGAPVSSTIYPGNLTDSVATFTDNSTATFVNGTMVNVSTYGSNTVALLITSQTVQGGTSLGSSNWTIKPVTSACSALDVANGASFTCAGVSLTVACPFAQARCSYLGGSGVSGTRTHSISVYDGASGTRIQFAQSVNTNSTIISPLSSVITSSSVYVCFDGNGSAPSDGTCTGSGASDIIKQNVTTPSGFNLLTDVNDTSSGVASVSFFSNVRVSSYAASGTYTSSAFNTSFSTPTMANVAVTMTSATVSGITMQQQNSSDGSSWSTASTLNQNAQALNGKQYWRYLLNYTTSNGTTTATSAGLGTLTAATTAYYISPCVVVSTPSTWGILGVNAVNNGGSFSLWLSTGGTCAAATSSSATWNAQTANAIITVTTATADLGIRVLFSLDSGTQTPILNNLSVNWNSGSSRPSVASAAYLNRYYLFYTTSTTSSAANDHVAVYDQNGHWEILNDVNAASTALYLNSLYIGDSQATGTSYLFDTGSDDAGRSYNFAFTTPDLDGGDPVSPKHWSRAYLLLGAPSSLTANTSLACTYTLDGSTETYTLGTVNLSEAPTQSGYFVAKFPFSGANPTTSHWVNLSCSNTGTAGPIRVYGMRLVFTPGAWP